MSTALTSEQLELTQSRVFKFSVDQYHQLGESGVLSPDDRVELLEGWIVEKMNQKTAHGFVVGFLTQWLGDRLGSGWIARCQLPITLDRSEPEPDIAVVRGSHSDYRNRHPSGSDCRLVIEVADTSVPGDRAKAKIYASTDIEEYWLVNLVENQLERMRTPQGASYNDLTILKSSATVKLTIGETIVSLPLNEILD